MKTIQLSPESRLTISLATLLITASLMIGCFLLVSAREEKLRDHIYNAANLEPAENYHTPAKNRSTPLEIAPGTFVTWTASSGSQSEIKIHWQSRFAAFGDSVAWIIIFGIPASIAAIILFGFSYLRAAVILPLRQESDTLRSQVVATRDMQMFAHDIRKPFSAVKAVVDILRQTNTSTDASNIARKMLPEIESILLHVDQMIADTLQKNMSEENPELVALDQALVEAVRESERKHPHANHRIQWQLQHTRKLSSTDKNFVRAVANLLCNAIEAMTPSDSVMITSSDVFLQDTSAIAIRVRNTGSTIPESILKKLFTPFATAGKKEGTGLGLAFVRKMVETAGGTVVATSDSKNGTEFILTLPAAAGLDKLQVALPNQFNADRKPTNVTPPAKVISILVVEDNDIYYEALVTAAQDIMGKHVNFMHARTVAEGTRMLANHPDILICDIDLDEQENGLSVIRAALSLSKKPAIYVHSNTPLSAEGSHFIGVHTSGVLTKPVTRDALAVLFEQHTRAPKSKLSKPKIAVIDDDCFVRELWSIGQDDVDVTTYSSPEEFKAAIQQEKTLLESFTAIIIDYYFDNSNEYTGDFLAQEIREIVSVPLIMSSDVTNLPQSTVSIFDLVITKDCVSWVEINRRLTQKISAVS